MHPAPAFRWDDPARLSDFVAAAAFVRLFMATPDGPRIAHAPVLRQRDGAFRFHLANGNALVPHLDGALVLLLAEGPNGYLSGNWYADVRGAVPSWNYVAVECEARATRLDQAALADLLDQMAAELEPRVGEDWTRGKMEPARFDAMTRAITAFELRPERWRGTFKASQNKPAVEVERLAAGMARHAPDMARLMRGEAP